MIKASAAGKKGCLDSLKSDLNSSNLALKFWISLSLCTNLQEFSVTDHACPQATFIFPIRNVSAAGANGPNQEVRGD